MNLTLPRLDGRAGTAVLLLYRTLAVITVLYVIATLPLEGVDLFRNTPATARYGFAVQSCKTVPEVK